MGGCCRYFTIGLSLACLLVLAACRRPGPGKPSMATRRAAGPGPTHRSDRLLCHHRHRGWHDRNGFGYTLDRETGKLLVPEKFDPSVNWASHIDKETTPSAARPLARGELLVFALPGSK